MKKLSPLTLMMVTIDIVLLIVIAMLLVACSNYDGGEAENAQPLSMFITVGDNTIGPIVKYHEDSKVMYLFYHDSVVVMLNPDGTPMLYSEE